MLNFLRKLLRSKTAPAPQPVIAAPIPEAEPLPPPVVHLTPTGRRSKKREPERLELFLEARKELVRTFGEEYSQERMAEVLNRHGAEITQPTLSPIVSGKFQHADGWWMVSAERLHKIINTCRKVRNARKAIARSQESQASHT